MLLRTREKAPYPSGKQKVVHAQPVSEAGGQAAQFLLGRVSVPQGDGEVQVFEKKASQRLSQRLPPAHSHEAQVCLA